MTNMAGDAIEIQRLKGQVRSLARGNAVDLMELGKTIYDRYKQAKKWRKRLSDAAMLLRTERLPSVNMRRRSQDKRGFRMLQLREDGR